jgi:DNA-directed RNA polymerase subunit M/transcription elongation factor TFIIS
MADKDLRHCPHCGAMFIENSTYDTPDRCPRCGHEAAATMHEAAGETEAVMFGEVLEGL